MSVSCGLLEKSAEDNVIISQCCHLANDIENTWVCHLANGWINRSALPSSK